MNNVLLIAVAWLAVIAHVAVAILARRRPADFRLVPLLNLTVAVCVLAYWVPKWFGYVSRGIAWYATDQLLPLYALAVCLLAGLSLAGRYDGSVPHWIVFGIDAVALLGAALLFTFFRINRLF